MTTSNFELKFGHLDTTKNGQKHSNSALDNFTDHYTTTGKLETLLKPEKSEFFVGAKNVRPITSSLFILNLHTKIVCFSLLQSLPEQKC